ncbi:Eukaryotic translation initiation factor 1b [Galemys pyrenaicus]|uniref:Eukaryotic translation initiation factor 1b n=1 Tax=Galemys pyrenaicus TaxID=202257 RepID=A0A8J6DUU7_GALPY|nr:Eukaryotic translation initiation factor 1b [Galemys pyrenaicus]
MYPVADPFADATKGDDLLPAGTEDYIHIRIQQRNGRKTLTTVQGIADDYDKKKLVKAFKKVKVLGRKVQLCCHILLQKFACNGTVIEHPEYGEVIQLQGDQRKNICQFLLEVSCFMLALSRRNSLRFMDSKMNLNARRIS